MTNRRNSQLCIRSTQTKMLRHYHENPASFNATSTANYSLSCIPKTQAPVYYYTGEEDELHMRKKIGSNNLQTDKTWQTYTGNFVLDNQHGDGTYKWKTDEGDIVYEGYIYCNNIQGYGRFSYPDGSTHEGLYKNNQRFGPGIHTEPSGRQSVGIWCNQKLIKLAIKVETGVPSMVSTPQGKTKILSFRNILPIDKSCPDKAKAIFMEMGAPKHILKISDCLYNMYGKDNRSSTFNWPLYNKTFYPITIPLPMPKRESVTSDQPHADSISKSIAQSKKGKSSMKYPKRKTKQRDSSDEKLKSMEEAEREKTPLENLIKNATHLLAWNNSPAMVEMLLYCFKHYNQEDIVTYDVADILQNNRKCFRAPGTHEILCVRYLRKCHLGDHWRVDDYLAFKAIDPNLSDCEGNTGLLAAAANDQHSVIDVILDRGANINLCNNEGFTPLALCMARYLALVNKIKDWEQAFLNNPAQTTYPENLLKWRHPESELEDSNPTDVHDEMEGERDRERRIETAEEDGEERDQFPTRSKVAMVKSTILKLLRRGADPQISNVPMAVLLIAVKCRDDDLVKILLETGADPNERVLSEDGEYSPLYLAVTLPADEVMVAICKLLLKHGADPNAGIQGTEEDEKIFKFCDLEDDEVGYKSILHTLVTRDDGIYYDENLSAALNTLIAYKADPSALYLGQSCLSAAIVRGNVNMVQILLESGKADPNQKLADELGVPLTVLLAAQCAPNIPIEDAAEIVNSMVDHGADLLANVQVGDFSGNILEFAQKEYELHKKKKRSKERPDKKSDYKVLLEYTTKLAQGLVIKMIKDLLKETSVKPGRSTLARAKSSPGLSTVLPKRSSRFSKLGKSPISRRGTDTTPKNKLPDWLGPEDVVHVLNIIHDQDKNEIKKEQAAPILRMAMPSETLDDEQYMEKLLSQVKGLAGYAIPEDKARERRSTKTSVASKQWDMLFSKKQSLRKIKMPSKAPSNKAHKNTDKNFDVCFTCERSFRNELLTLCPECKRVKFCSEECFLKARQNNTHKCKTNIEFDNDNRKSHFPDKDDSERRGSKRRSGREGSQEKHGSYGKRQDDGRRGTARTERGMSGRKSTMEEAEKESSEEEGGGGDTRQRLETHDKKRESRGRRSTGKDVSKYAEERRSTQGFSADHQGNEGNLNKIEFDGEFPEKVTFSRKKGKDLWARVAKSRSHLKPMDSSEDNSDLQESINLPKKTGKKGFWGAVAKKRQYLKQMDSSKDNSDLQESINLPKKTGKKGFWGEVAKKRHYLKQMDSSKDNSDLQERINLTKKTGKRDLWGDIAKKGVTLKKRDSSMDNSDLQEKINLPKKTGKRDFWGDIATKGVILRKRGTSKELNTEQLRKGDSITRDDRQKQKVEIDLQSGNRKSTKFHMGQGDSGDARIEMRKKSTRGETDPEERGSRQSDGEHRRGTSARGSQRSSDDRRSSEQEYVMDEAHGSQFVHKDGSLYYVHKNIESLKKENYAFT